MEKINVNIDCPRCRSLENEFILDGRKCKTCGFQWIEHQNEN